MSTFVLSEISGRSVQVVLQEIYGRAPARFTSTAPGPAGEDGVGLPDAPTTDGTYYLGTTVSGGVGTVPDWLPLLIDETTLTTLTGILVGGHHGSPGGDPLEVLNATAAGQMLVSTVAEGGGGEFNWVVLDPGTEGQILTIVGGVPTWVTGTSPPPVPPYTPSLDFSDARNSQYALFPLLVV
jgi:hypothetical protein